MRILQPSPAEHTIVLTGTDGDAIHLIDALETAAGVLRQQGSRPAQRQGEILAELRRGLCDLTGLVQP